MFRAGDRLSTTAPHLTRRIEITKVCAASYGYRPISNSHRRIGGFLRRGIVERHYTKIGR